MSKCRHDVSEDCPTCMSEDIIRLAVALSRFLATDETMEGILWGKEPDTALVKISIPLGQYREARKVLSQVTSRVGNAPQRGADGDK